MDSINCCICQEDVRQPMAKPDCCTHLFCLECLEPWLRERNTCPLDRHSVHSIQLIESKSGGIVKCISVPEASSNFDVSDDGMVFDFDIWPENADEWMSRINAIMEYVHDILLQMLNFNGNMHSYLEANQDIPEELYLNNFILYGFKLHLEGIREPPFHDRLSSESRQLYEQLLINYERSMQHHFKQCSQKFGVRLSHSGSTDRPYSNALLQLISTTYDHIWDFIDCFLSFTLRKILFAYADKRRRN
ncbi:unnamed protein product, partial [Hymenolepis diminuta]